MPVVACHARDFGSDSVPLVWSDRRVEIHRASAIEQHLQALVALLRPGDLRAADPADFGGKGLVAGKLGEQVLEIGPVFEMGGDLLF